MMSVGFLHAGVPVMVKTRLPWQVCWREANEIPRTCPKLKKIKESKYEQLGPNCALRNVLAIHTDLQ